MEDVTSRGCSNEAAVLQRHTEAAELDSIMPFHNASYKMDPCWQQDKQNLLLGPPGVFKDRLEQSNTLGIDCEKALIELLPR